MNDFKDLAEGWYHIYTPKEPQPSLVKVYTAEGFKGVGFGPWDGACFMPLSHIMNDSVFVPVEIKESNT